jgi:hypothetical protein
MTARRGRQSPRPQASSCALQGYAVQFAILGDVPLEQVRAAAEAIFGSR